MAPKKKVINGFSIYLHEQRAEYSKKGFGMSMEEAVKMFQPRYKNMDPSEKEVYESRAKKAKEQQKNDPTQKFDAYGISVAERNAELQKENRERNQMHNDIRKTVKDRRDAGELEHQVFYIGHFNYAVFTDEKEYIPCELAIAKYSLAEGVINVYHCLIKPGPIPTGYSFAAKDHSEKTHQIPSDGIPELSDASYSGQVIRMSHFLKNADGEEQPIYFLQEEMEPAKCMMRDLFKRAGEYRKPIFKVYDLNKLFFELMRDTPKNFPIEEHVGGELKTEKFDYELGLACVFHDPLDNPKFCSRHAVYRWSYVISDYCATAYQVQLKSGRHYPAKPQSNVVVGWGDEEEEEEEEEASPFPATDMRYPNPQGNYGREEPLPEFEDPEESEGWTIAGASCHQPAAPRTIRRPTSQGSVMSGLWSQESSRSAASQQPVGVGRGIAGPPLAPAWGSPRPIGRGRGMLDHTLNEEMSSLSLGGRVRGGGFPR